MNILNLKQKRRLIAQIIENNNDPSEESFSKADKVINVISQELDGWRNQYGYGYISPRPEIKQ